MRLTEEERGTIIQALVEFRLRKKPVRFAVNKRLQYAKKHLAWGNRKGKKPILTTATGLGGQVKDRDKSQTRSRIRTIFDRVTKVPASRSGNINRPDKTQGPEQMLASTMRPVHDVSREHVIQQIRARFRKSS